MFSFAYWLFELIDGQPGFFRSLYFSIVTQTTLGYGDLHPDNSIPAMSMVILQSTLGIFIFGLASALMVFKLLQPAGAVFRFDRHAVFYPSQGVLRVRVLNQLPATVSNVEVRAYLRTWLSIEPPARYGTYDVPLKRTLIPRMPFLEPWNIATRPTDDVGGDVNEHEKDRVLDVLSPIHIDERSNITVTLIGHVDDLKSTVSGSRTYQASEIVCGKYRFVDPLGVTTMHVDQFQWENWDEFDETPLSDCQLCRFSDACCFSLRKKEGANKPTAPDGSKPVSL